MKKYIIILLFSLIFSPCVISADTQNAQSTSVTASNNNQKQSFFKRIFAGNKTSNKAKKAKKLRVEEVQLPPVIQGRPKIPFSQLSVMTIDDCVQYALSHDPSLKASEARVQAAKAGIGIARSNYAPRIGASFGYNHTMTQRSNIPTINGDTMGFNVGISEMIWDFGRTTAKINMAKYDTESMIYDHTYETLNVIYLVRICYYKVLSALANLDIYEQNVRIQTLNYERTKAMFDEGLKSKIDVVNAEVNLTDAKIQLVEGQNNLITSIIALQNEMYYEEEKPFVVKNTESFNFLKSDYREKFENVNNSSQPKTKLKKDEDGLITLSSGIEHNDIIQDYVFNPMKLTKQEAVDKALDFRPDLKSVRMVVNVQDEALKAIRRQYAPAINGDLSWGYNHNLRSEYTSPLQFGANIAVGSVNPYGIYYQIKEGENYLDIAKHNYNIAKSDIYWEVQDYYVNMRNLERKIPLMHTKVKATLENFKLADGRYSVGLNNYVELQDALTNYNKSQLNFVEAVFSYNVARENLLKSMGIGLDKEGRGKSGGKSGNKPEGKSEEKWQNDI